MDQTILGIQLATLLILIIGGLILKSYLPSYFSEKGKNLATREDIEEITDKIEGIRAQHTAETERLRASLTYATGEQIRLREKQTETLLKFYESCRAVAKAEARLIPSKTGDPDALSMQLQALEDACFEVADNRIRLALYMSPKHKVYEVASTLANHISKLLTTATKHLELIIKRLREEDPSSIDDLINEFNIVMDIEAEAVTNNLTLFVLEFNMYATSYREIEAADPKSTDHRNQARTSQQS